jgi:hypothetical protein
VTPTAKKSIDIEIPCPAMTAADRDAVVAAVLAAAERQSLLVTLTTTHTSYPDSIHWHFKPERRIRGVLDLTYWPDGGRLWLSVRAQDADWIGPAADALAEALAEAVRDRRFEQPA